MDREIKFRGKAKDGVWVYGSYIYAHKWFGDGKAGHFICDIYGDCRDLVDSKTVGQFTGLYDKNGKEIYEGDIVFRTQTLCRQIDGVYKNITYKYFLIQYTDEDVASCGCCYSQFDGVGFVGQNKSGIRCWYLRDSVVVGNIYDNPELLEENKDD